MSCMFLSDLPQTTGSAKLDRYHKVSQSCSEEGICVAVNYWYARAIYTPCPPLLVELSLLQVRYGLQRTAVSCHIIREIGQPTEKQRPVG